MNTAHELILLAGALGLISVFAGIIGARFNAPILLVFLLLGMLAGEDGLTGSIAIGDHSLRRRIENRARDDPGGVLAIARARDHRCRAYGPLLAARILG